MFNKLTTFAKIRLVISVVWLIVFFTQATHDWYDILLGYLLCDSVQIVCKFASTWIKTATTELEELIQQIEAKNNQK